MPPVMSGVVPSACPYPGALFVRKAPIVEQLAQPIRGGTIDVVGVVRVEPDREHGIAVPETTLHDPGCSPLATMSEVATWRRP
ncbi:MAG: hypothetical protein ACRENI_08930 [Gemmatimonadaceae bacterium]